MSAPAIATLRVDVSCVCRAVAREHLLTIQQAARQRRRLRYPELYAANVSLRAMHGAEALPLVLIIHTVGG